MVVVDDDDLPSVSRHNWRVRATRTNLYAAAHIGTRGVLIHRLIMGAKKGQIVDHIDRDGLNNQRSNLRFVTPKENRANSRPMMSSHMLLKRFFPMMQRAARENRYQPTSDEDAFLRLIEWHLKPSVANMPSPVMRLRWYR